MKVNSELTRFRDLSDGEVFILRREHYPLAPLVKISSLEEGVTALYLHYTKGMTYMVEVGLDEEVIKCSEITCKF